MTLVNTETGKLVEDFMSRFWSSMTAPIWDAIGQDDDRIFEGLDERTVAYLRARISEHPDLRGTLAQAADYRKSRGSAIKRQPASARLVYFIEAAGSNLVKIGSAVSPESRVRTLQTGSPVQLRLLGSTPGGESHERDLHRRFSHLRSHGEWFRSEPELVEHIARAVR